MIHLFSVGAARTSWHTAAFDSLAEAYGTYSRVRRLISPPLPLYRAVADPPISLIPKILWLPELHDTVELISLGSLYAMENKRMLGMPVNGGRCIHTYP